MDAINLTDWFVFILVVGLRFLLPLLIPYFPLPAIVACLLLDGVDQTIFQVFTDLPLAGYQSYDKALDVYYLTVAYLSTLRNWSHLLAFRVSRFLYYYRLVGVVAFELTGLRPLLLLFPNTFEYFFIWYEAVRLWSPRAVRRLTRVGVISAAAFIWIVIKLPQEYWIHIAQRDVTDTIKALLGGGPETPWGPLLAENWLLIAAVGLVLGAALFLLVRYLRRALPPPDRPLAWRADPAAGITDTNRPALFNSTLARTIRDARIFDRFLVEKVILLGLLLIIFFEMLPTANLQPTQVAISVAVFVTVLSAISTVLSRRGTRVASGVVHFVALAAAGLALMALISLLAGGGTNWFNAMIFILLISVIITLYDRFVLYHLARKIEG